MRKTNSLKLIPDNAKLFDGFSSISLDSGFMTLDEKIKRDPLNREKFRCEAKISSGFSPQRRMRRGFEPELPVPQMPSQPASYNPPPGGYPQIPGIQPVAGQPGMPQMPPMPDFGDGPKDFIKNLTPYEIILDFHPNSEGLSKGQRPPKPKTVKHFIGKWEIRDFLEHHILIGLYKTGRIVDVTEAQAKWELDMIGQQKAAEEDQLNARRMRAEQYRRENPHVGGGGDGLRRLGAGGVEMIIPDMPVGMGGAPNMMGAPMQAETGDGGVFHFDAGGSDIGVRNPRGDMSEHEALVSSIVTMP